MAERYVDAAIADAGGQRAYFFLTDQYVVFDYAADRVVDGVHPLSAFPPGAPTGFPGGFAARGPGARVDAAISGRAAFSAIDYFFAGASYVRYSRDLGAFDPPWTLPLTAWNLPAGMAPPDAAFDGAKNREGFGFFFTGGRYARYEWVNDRFGADYPRPISALVGLTAPFTNGVDAAVDGAGPFSDASYLFTDESYLRFQWVAAGEPHADGGTRPIAGNWPGLAELLLAAKAKSSALVWAMRAESLLAALAAESLSAADLAIVTIALATHFHIAPNDPRVPVVSRMFGRVLATLRDSPRTFRYRSDAEATADGRPDIAAAYAGPWPPSAASRLNFTRNFIARPPLNRVAVLIHESVHVNDPDSATPNVHVSEWYLTAPSAALFGIAPQVDHPDMAIRYDLMTADDAIHNPSAYAAFARHVTIGDSRELPG